VFCVFRHLKKKGVNNMPCAWGHSTYHSDYDACESESYDPDVGWGGFTDHFLGKHFSSEEEREEYIQSHRSEIDD
jgi:hypothetical protein